VADILVVDDDYDIRDTLREVLADSGYEVALAANGREALAWLRTNPLPRLVLLDWMMPVCDGATFRKEQLAAPAIAAVPVVLLTADARLDEKTRALDAEAYLTKPVELDALLALVRRFCGVPA
jgi:CheY-like chemotaxis protein